MCVASQRTSIRLQCFFVGGWMRIFVHTRINSRLAISV